jgi:fumarylacetoacetate (FAA) hydrolase
MKLATLKNATRDGQLVVVSRDLKRAVPADGIASTLQLALETWTVNAPKLQALSVALESGTAAGAIPFDPAAAHAPLPRSYAWIDGSCFKNHLRLLSLATGRDPEIEMNTPHPLVYQGGSDTFIPPMGDVALPTEDHAIDFEAEIGVIVDEVPMGTLAADAGRYIRLVLLINDVSLRSFIKYEISTGFGWMNAKPSSSFSPVAVTPDELGSAWIDGRLHLPVHAHWNGERFGTPNGSEMSWSFHDIIEHCARTRTLSAGTIIGSGTVSNANYVEVGSGCIAERRAIEMIEQGGARTNFMRFGDRVRIEMFDAKGASVFGAIDQKIVRYAPPTGGS